MSRPSAIATALAVAVAALLAAACADPSDGEPPVGELVLGTAATSGEGFIEVDDGAELDLVPGAQGGFHIWVSTRVHGAAGALYLEREARRVEDDALILRGQRVRVDVPAEALDTWWESDSAIPAFMCPAPLGVQVRDSEIYIDVRLTDAEGTIVATDQLFVTPRCPTGDQHAFCIDICSG